MYYACYFIMLSIFLMLLWLEEKIFFLRVHAAKSQFFEKRFGIAFLRLQIFGVTNNTIHNVYFFSCLSYYWLVCCAATRKISLLLVAIIIIHTCFNINNYELNNYKSNEFTLTNLLEIIEHKIVNFVIFFYIYFFLIWYFTTQ